VWGAGRMAFCQYSVPICVNEPVHSGGGVNVVVRAMVQVQAAAGLVGGVILGVVGLVVVVGGLVVVEVGVFVLDEEVEACSVVVEARLHASEG
jgi:hypothetical protein